MHRATPPAIEEIVAEAAAEQASDTLQDRLPELMDQALGRLREVGIDRILMLAEAMVQERLQEPAEAHLTSSIRGN